ncbi:MAG: CDP-alcohol phosphatidyltransferase family protein [Planctomycetaceae bacterium]|nr:CDP-alcohol phosphatidyltransferase family protein [Planctomycetaceae bacterium]
MGASWNELRRVCQLPVRAGNDVAGLLFGDHASLVITKVFVDLNLSPNYASVGFLVAGLLGAGLQVGTGACALAGAVLLVLYYVLDCVDGEVARWQKVVNVHWGYFDYLFHMLIKPLAFFGIGLGCHLAGDTTWPLVAAFAAAVSTLWRKILIEIPGILFLKDVLRKGTAQRLADASPNATSSPMPSSGGKAPEPFRLRADLVTLRAILTNFDVGLLFLTVASALDVAFDAPNFGPLGTHSFRALWLAYYGALLPLDFLDYLVTYLRKRHFSTEMTRLLSAAHDFRAEEREQR